MENREVTLRKSCSFESRMRRLCAEDLVELARAIELELIFRINRVCVNDSAPETDFLRSCRKIVRGQLLFVEMKSVSAPGNK
jgi:hypothetical protein